MYMAVRFLGSVACLISSSDLSLHAEWYASSTAEDPEPYA